MEIISSQVTECKDSPRHQIESECVSKGVEEQCTPRRPLSVNFRTPMSRTSTARIHRRSTEKLKAAFKSPVRQCPAAEVKEKKDVASLAMEVEELRQRDKDLGDQIKTLTDQGFQVAELHSFITKLHEYNEMKDTGQMLLGRIAVQEGVTTRDLYPQFDLELDD